MADLKTASDLRVQALEKALASAIRDLEVAAVGCRERGLTRTAEVLERHIERYKETLNG